MTNNPQQLQDDDAVIGGHTPSIEGAVVLGGMEGIKARLNNSDPQVRIAALEQAINYQEQGLDLVIQSLNDESREVQDRAYLLLSERREVQDRAYLLLSERAERKIKKTLREFNPEGLKLEVIEVVKVNKFGEIVQRQKHIARYLIEDLGNGITLEMAKIPGGTFMMGAPEGEGRDWEKPQHEVTVQQFFMGKYQITQAHWKTVASSPKVNRDLEPNPSKFNGGNCPVECVSWYEAEEFCDRLSKLTKRLYRLPSEAEWEYACRAGTTTPFHFGETITTDLARYTYGDGVKGIYRKGTTKVGSFGVANNFGLYDMHGNVWEWCQDNFHKSYECAPTDGIAWISKNGSQARVMHGGSWDTSPEVCRSAFRNWSSPDFRYPVIGFRVALSDVARTLP